MSDFDEFDARLVALVTEHRDREQVELELPCPAPLTEDSIQQVLSSLRAEFPEIMANDSAIIEVRRAAYTC